MEAMGYHKEDIPEQEAAIHALREQVCGTDHFIALAKTYTDVQELPPGLLRLFIRKLMVHEKANGASTPSRGWRSTATTSGGGHRSERSRVYDRARIDRKAPGRPCEARSARGSGHRKSCPYQGVPITTLSFCRT